MTCKRPKPQPKPSEIADPHPHGKVRFKALLDAMTSGNTCFGSIK